MKRLLLIIFATLLYTGCSNDDDSGAALPPTTTTGAGTFACKINGKSFIDPGSTFNCFYQYTNGGYYFGISGADEDYKRTNTPWALNLYAQNVVFQQGEIYQLVNEADGNVTANANFSFSTNDFFSQETSSEYTGELTLTKFGTFNGTNIISGTFWFNVQHPLTGETIRVTDGRFDTTYLD
ncbi:hypothetical protein [Flavobacterium coralii]|uniref:hypothetical protein n=1 Tax=Flavobacterium coralii TaxID=2838017 RepID=UPI000C400F83|nr:hypothetical protein [Flavobacterium sp.]|tara:strand:- start:255 stop:797 length:543 start_codon:yes stop_codon:yes gene_type:complete